MSRSDADITLQREYYRQTAAGYDEAHVKTGDEHYFALSFMLGVLDGFGIQSVLDVGSGTGRVPQRIKQLRPDIHMVGIEPVDEMRAIGHAAGLSPDTLIPGDVMNLQFPDCAFDLVCAFGVLHHVPRPQVAVSEMLRVARKAVFISDSNNFAQGGPAKRAAKFLLRRLRLWPLAVLFKTRGKGYTLSPGDGLAFSYSVFGNYSQLEKVCDRIHVMNTRGDGRDAEHRAGHVALLGLKSHHS